PARAQDPRSRLKASATTRPGARRRPDLVASTASHAEQDLPSARFPPTRDFHPTPATRAGTLRAASALPLDLPTQLRRSQPQARSLVSWQPDRRSHGKSLLRHVEPVLPRVGLRANL